MRVLSSIAVVAFLGVLAAPARAGIAENCEQDHDPDLQIDGCTAVIFSGSYSGKSLAGAYNNRGAAFGNRGELRRAIEEFSRAVWLDPGYAKAFNNRGIAYFDLGQHRRAIRDYDQALELDPGYASVYYNRGYAYKSLGEHTRATGDWDRATRIDGAPMATLWQTYLKGKGYYAGAIDGVYGPDTKRGLSACARDPDC